MTITGTGGVLLRRRSLGSWASLACLAGVLGCGGPTAVQPPVNNTVSIPTGPTKTVDDPAKSSDAGGGDSSAASKAPPAVKLVPADELQHVVAALANDDPEQPLTRVWFRQDVSQDRLVDVVLSNSLVTDDGLAKLAGIARLRHLNLDNCREITSDGLAHLKALKDLRKLSLNRTAVGDAGLAHLPALPGLTELSLIGNAGVTDAGAAHLASCPALRVLRLQDTHMGDKGLAELQAAPQLRELYLDGSRVTEKGMADFAAARPGTQIIHPLRPVKRSSVTSTLILGFADSVISLQWRKGFRSKEGSHAQAVCREARQGRTKRTLATGDEGKGRCEEADSRAGVVVGGLRQAWPGLEG